MKKLVISAIFSIFTASALSSPAINLDEGIEFTGKCAALTIKGSTDGSIETYFRPNNFVASLAGKSVFDINNSDLPIVFEHMSIHCEGEPGKQKLVIAGNCMGRAAACENTFFYVIDAKSGAMIAPKNTKSDKYLCNAKCADKILGNGAASAIESGRYN